MATWSDLILAAEADLDQATKRKDRAIAEVKAIAVRAQNEGRPTLTAEEDSDCKTLFERRDAALEEIEGIKSKLAHYKRAKEADDLADQHLKETRETIGRDQRPAYDRVARIGAEERTYRPDHDPKGTSFLRDVVRAFRRDPEAEMRIMAHIKEERVERGQYLERAAGDATTAAFAGLTVPQYLTDLYAPAVAALRPFADICNHHDLPAQGMTINISQITTATTAAAQATQLTAVSATSIDDTLLTENVLTAAGQQTLSRQAIERGTGIEEVTLQDLFKRYATSLDSQLITTATTGLSAVATATTYTDTTPTAAELYPKILGAVSGVEAALLAQAVPSHVIMHSRRWYWMASQLVSTWPFIASANIPPRAAGMSAGNGYNEGARGVLPMGMPVIVDNNIATNLGGGTEDEIYVVASDECHLWEDPRAPVFIRAEQPAAANLGVLLVVYGYFAFSLRRYANGAGKVSGSGLATPTF